MNVLFVCTGNIFRSMSAEFLLKAQLGQLGLSSIQVRSAGTHVSLDTPNIGVVNAFNELGIDITSHRQSPITKEHIEWANIIFCMGVEHQQFLKEKFSVHALLFDEIAIKQRVSVLDNWQAVYEHQKHPKESALYCYHTVYFLYHHMPAIVSYLKTKV